MNDSAIHENSRTNPRCNDDENEAVLGLSNAAKSFADGCKIRFIFDK